MFPVPLNPHPVHPDTNSHQTKPSTTRIESLVALATAAGRPWAMETGPRTTTSMEAPSGSGASTSLGARRTSWSPSDTVASHDPRMVDWESEVGSQCGLSSSGSRNTLVSLRPGESTCKRVQLRTRLGNASSLRKDKQKLARYPPKKEV